MRPQTFIFKQKVTVSLISNQLYSILAIQEEKLHKLSLSAYRQVELGTEMLATSSHVKRKQFFRLC